MFLLFAYFMPPFQLGILLRGHGQFKPRAAPISVEGGRIVKDGDHRAGPSTPKKVRPDTRREPGS